MSHKIKVEGNFGSPEALKNVLAAQGVQYNEGSENGKVFLTFPDRRYNLYGNPLRICLSHPEDSTMDSDVGRIVRAWFRDSMVEHVKTQLLFQGARMISQQTSGDNIVLRLAIG